MSAFPTAASSGKGSGFDPQLIEKEIAHLKKKKSVRHGPREGPRLSSWLIFFGITGMLWLYFMDPVLYAYHRGEAIRAYLYLHNYGDDRKAAALATCGLLDAGDIQILDKKEGSFQDYFYAMGAANEKARRLEDYMTQVKALHHGAFAELTPVSQLRYFLFIKTGLTPPTTWQFLTPNIK